MSEYRPDKSSDKTTGKYSLKLPRLFVDKAWRFLTPREKAILPVLLLHSPHIFPGRARIGELAGIKRSAVSRGVAELESASIISVSQRVRKGGSFQTNEYVIANLADADVVDHIVRRLAARLVRTVRHDRKRGHGYAANVVANHHQVDEFFQSNPLNKGDGLGELIGRDDDDGGEPVRRRTKRGRKIVSNGKASVERVLDADAEARQVAESRGVIDGTSEALETPHEAEQALRKVPGKGGALMGLSVASRIANDVSALPHISRWIAAAHGADNPAGYVAWCYREHERAAQAERTREAQGRAKKERAALAGIQSRADAHAKSMDDNDILRALDGVRQAGGKDAVFIPPTGNDPKWVRDNGSLPAARMRRALYQHLANAQKGAGA